MWMAEIGPNLIRSPWRSLNPYPRLPAWWYLRRAARRYPDGAAVIDGNGLAVSFQQLWQNSLAIARHLQRVGNISAGETVVVGSQGGCEAAAALFGALLAGARASPIGVGLRRHDAAHQLRDSNAVYAIAPEPLLGTIRYLAAAGRAPSLRGTLAFGSVRDLALAGPTLPERVLVDPERDVAMLPYSSGSSGLPKGVMLTHSQFVAATRQQLAISNLNRRDRVMNLRLAWTRVQLTVAAGATYISPGGRDAEAIADQIERFRPTVLLIKPPELQSLVDEQRHRRRDVSSLRYIETGAEALAVGLEREAMDVLGYPVFQAYHQTETCGSSNRARPHEARAGAVGWPAPDTDERVVDVDTGVDVPFGAEGELLIRGPQVMQGYLNNAAETDRALSPDGWFRTGDLVRQDTAGQVVIVDRIKDLIKFRGIPIAPMEIEQVLLQHPAVREAAVAPVASGVDGQRPRAFVVLEQGAELTRAELTALVASQLAAHKLPDSIELVTSLPRNAAGKVLRRELARCVRQSSTLSWSGI